MCNHPSHIWEAVVNSFWRMHKWKGTLLDCTLVAENHALTYCANRLHNWYTCPNKPFATSHACFSLRKSCKSHTMLTLLYVRTALAFTTKSSPAAFLQFIDAWCGLVVRPITATSRVVSNNVLEVIGWPYLRLDQKCLSRLVEYEWRHRRGPFLVLPRAPPPTLNPPLWMVLVKLINYVCRFR